MIGIGVIKHTQDMHNVFINIHKWKYILIFIERFFFKIAVYFLLVKIEEILVHNSDFNNL